MLQTIFTNLLIGIVGLIFFTLLDSKDYFFNKDKTWNLNIFLTENLKSWIFLALLILVAAVLSGISPELLTIFKISLGIDLVATPIGFFTLGIILKAVLKK